MQSIRLALCGLLACSCYGDESAAFGAGEPARASPLSLYVPQVAVPKVPQVNAPRSPVPQMSVPQEPQVPKMQPMPEIRQVAEMPPMGYMPMQGVPSTVVDQLGRPYVLAQPTEEKPASSVPFLSFHASLGAGFAAGMTLVQSFLKKNGHKVSAKKLALGALSVVTAAGIAFYSQAAHASVDQVGNLVATNANDFGGNTIPIIGLGVLAATISLLAGPVED